MHNIDKNNLSLSVIYFKNFCLKLSFHNTFCSNAVHFSAVNHELELDHQREYYFSSIFHNTLKKPKHLHLACKQALRELARRLICFNENLQFNVAWHSSRRHQRQITDKALHNSPLETFSFSENSVPGIL